MEKYDRLTKVFVFFFQLKTIHGQNGLTRYHIYGEFNGNAMGVGKWFESNFECTYNVIVGIFDSGQCKHPNQWNGRCNGC